MASVKSPRRERRARQRVDEKRAQSLRKVFQAQPGGSPSHAIPVASASLVEARAAGLACGLCGGACQLLSHEARTLLGKRLRVVNTRCRACGEVQIVYLEILLPN
jgi:hypothetical protein